MRCQLRRALLALAVLVAGPAVVAQSKGKLVKECDRVLQRHVAFGFHGTVLIADRGKPVFVRGYGLADERSGRKNAEHTLFEVASLTKQFTAAAILRLEQDGKIAVTDSIAKHLPGVPKHSEAITIHHLLAHTSGVPPTNTEGRGRNLERAVAVYLGDGPKVPLDEKWDYWNGGYALLAGIVERASGMSFVDYCRKKLFLPAGMKDSGFNGDRKLDARRAAFFEGRTAIDHPYGAYEWQYRGMGGAVTTVGDLLRWHTALLDDAVLGSAAREKLFHPHAPRMAHGRDYAYGWYVGKAPDGSSMAWHGGDVRGFHCQFRRYPKRDACVAVLANSSGDPIATIAAHLESLLFGKRPRSKLPPVVVPAKKKALKPLVGRYRAEGGATFELELWSDGLWLGCDDTGLARVLTGNPQVAKASFAVMPIGKGEYVAWNPWRQLDFDFQTKRRKVVAVKVGNAEYSRVK